MKAAAQLLALLVVASFLGPPPCRAAGDPPGSDPSLAGPGTAERTVGEFTIRLSGWHPSQGDPVLAGVLLSAPADNVLLLWKGGEYAMREERPGAYFGLFGVDLLEPPGPANLAVVAHRAGREVRAELEVEIRERPFPVQELTLPEAMTRFDAATLARIAREAEALAERFSRPIPSAMWTLPFHPPVEGFLPAGFGSRRIINGEPRSPHAGADMALPAGTPVEAIADGTVAFAGEQFFGGKSVVLDHGGGLFSLYYHLDEQSVSQGQPVARGARIGAVGSSGRATAPHLHFGVRAAGGRVDPSLLLALPPR